MSTRSYVSPVRSAVAAEKRDAVVQAATQFLRERSISEFSLDAIARSAGVTRLTVYNQFGSRKGLLEAVLDAIADGGKLGRLGTAIDLPDPWDALERLVEIFCDFWVSDPAIARLHDAIAIEQEFGEALIARNERRRKILTALIGRISSAPAAEQRKIVDLVFALTSSAMYRSLSNGRSKKVTREIIWAATTDAVKRIE